MSRRPPAGATPPGAWPARAMLDARPIPVNPDDADAAAAQLRALVRRVLFVCVENARRRRFPRIRRLIKERVRVLLPTLEPDA